ncbi:MAG TPA: FAD-binding oxidoreductase [Solirubrobacteraceae bacterium]|nr:FAD-binding oxidoreductase [Solirubrobacteraceae bacterium]
MNRITPHDINLESALAGIVGERYVLTDPGVKLAYERDVTGRYSGSARLVVLPADTAECAATLAACARHGAHVVPQGGNTGLVGGGTPRAGEIVLSTRRMSAIDVLDESAHQLTAGAGATLADAQRAASAAGFELTLDHGARSAATLGGLAATDAGGSLALRYGTMRRHVTGVEAVLADGRVVSRLSGLMKDNAGYRWHDLLVGSEGTLAVITRVRLAVAPPAGRRVSALFGVRSFSAALALLSSLRAHVPGLRAADFFTADGLELVCGQRRLSRPLRAPHRLYVVVECAGDGDLIAQLTGAARAGRESSAIDLDADVVVADDSGARARLWAYRDAQNEAIRANGVPHKLDVSVPLGQLPAFAHELAELLETQRPAARLVLYGHLGDGNVHVNILGLDESDERVDELVLRLAATHGGTISAEHGVGVAKVKWLGLVRSAEEIALMRSLKAAFDPDGVLSPGRVLPVRTAR